MVCVYICKLVVPYLVVCACLILKLFIVGLWEGVITGSCNLSQRKNI